jgi:hypothetical protein
MFFHLLVQGLVEMSIFDDIIILRKHYKDRRDWYFSAIERIESDIQHLWEEYFKSPHDYLSSYKIQEVGKDFLILKDSLTYFREAIEISEKRLEDLKQQEYALKGKKDNQIN